MHYQVITHTHSAWPSSLLLRKCKASELKVGVGPKAAETWNEQGVSRSREMSLLGHAVLQTTATESQLSLTALFIVGGGRCTCSEHGAEQKHRIPPPAGGRIQG